jgi:hypothetical protein
MLFLSARKKRYIMEIVGKIVQKLESQTGTSARGEWKKQAFVIETQEQYPKKVCIQNWNDKVQLDSFADGTLVKVSINVESREFNGRWYTDVTAWRMDVEGGANSPEADMPPPPGEIPPPDGEPASDDLPF